ncbi:MAG: hypothetical protein ACKVT1_02395 [Dehalococcoidia bacterium]
MPILTSSASVIGGLVFWLAAAVVGAPALLLLLRRRDDRERDGRSARALVGCFVAFLLLLALGLFLLGVALMRFEPN